MKILSDSSFSKLERRIEALEAENKQFEEKSRQCARRYHALMRTYQTLVLRVGLLGYNVEAVAEVPAKPATLRLAKVK